MVWALSLLTTELISRRLTPAISCNGIRSLSGFGSLVGPLAQLELYPR
jgi:hypothetical protein